MRVFVSSPELQPASLQVEPGTAVLLGRAPNPERLSGADAEIPVVQHPLNDSRVSSNHALVSNDGRAVAIRDLGSKNGTWVKLAPGSCVRLESTDTVVLQLAGVSAQGVTGEVQLPRLEWTEEAQFAEAARGAIVEYLERSGLRARVSRVVGALERTEAAHVALQLEDGSTLLVEWPADRTSDPRLAVALDHIRSWIALENAAVRGRRHAGEGLILASPAIRQAHDQVEEAAHRGVRVVLLGPTGSGKDRLARCYHEHSSLAHGPFHAVNCGQLSKELIYAQLFGAKKGSFTGATHDVIGAVQAASDGTLFLDEVSDMPKEVQSAVLRFLDRRGEYCRLGEEDRPRTARNVQIVCATSADVRQKIERGELREDLWYRIAERTVVVKPLSERREDVLAFLKSSLPGERREQTLERGAGAGVSVYDALTGAAREVVENFGWRGNFRSLESFVVRLPAGAGRQSIGLETCRDALADHGSGGRTPQDWPSAPASEMSSERWQQVLTLASAAYARDEGSPATWGALLAFVERYLKPAFVAHLCKLEHARTLERSVNLSQLARQLDLKDGTTVKTHLLRYFGMLMTGR